VALGVGLAVALPGEQHGTRAVHVNLDAWSVNTTPSDQVTVTIRDLKDPALLRQTLGWEPRQLHSGPLRRSWSAVPSLR
jgi:hypothetical protein